MMAMSTGSGRITLSGRDAISDFTRSRGYTGLAYDVFFNMQ